MSRGGLHRLFAVAYASVDVILSVKAADWPHTFVEPYVLGHDNWPEKYASSEFLWSADGSVVVWWVRGVSEKAKRYEAAYDYREHRGIGLRQHRWNTRECDDHIRTLVEERGGLKEPSVQVPSLNTGMY